MDIYGARKQWSLQTSGLSGRGLRDRFHCTFPSFVVEPVSNYLLWAEMVITGHLWHWYKLEPNKNGCLFRGKKFLCWSQISPYVSCSVEPLFVVSLIWQLIVSLIIGWFYWMVSCLWGQRKSNIGVKYSIDITVVWQPVYAEELDIHRDFNSLCLSQIWHYECSMI